MHNNFQDLENEINTIVKTRLVASLSEDFPNIDTGTSDINDIDATNFPYIYVHMLPSTEQGADLEQNRINAIKANIQIEISDNESQKNTEIVANEIVEIMRDIHFGIAQFPINSNTAVYRKVIRFTRTIGYNDTL